MSASSKIEWTDATWNPVRGCSRVSEGCRNCYAERWSAGPYGAASPSTDEKFAIFGNSGPRWTGKVELIESKLDEPLHWREPRRIFVNSMSDLFHESLPDEAIDQIFAVMALRDDHTFQILTKRAERMQRYCYFRNEDHGQQAKRQIFPHMRRWLGGKMQHTGLIPWPPPNVHLGVSVESREDFAIWNRIDLLRQTPAAVRFLSLEPLLEDIGVIDLTGIHQVIVGGESGPGARPMNPDWVRSIRDQCVAAGVPFFFKQWGEWTPTYHGKFTKRFGGLDWYFRGYPKFDDVPANDGTGTHHRMFRVGKKAAGRLLDGRTWDEQPQ